MTHPATDERYFFEDDLHSWRIDFYENEFDYEINENKFVF